MASSRKPVIVRKFSRDWHAGYVGSSELGTTPELEILDLSGKVLRIAWEHVKWVCSVRDLPSADSTNPERLLRKHFAVRPRNAGLWLRLTLTDGDEIEGLAANDRSLIDGVGLLLTPPDTRSNTQRVFIPRPAILSLEMLGLIHPPGQRRTQTGEQSGEQPKLFPSDPEAESSTPAQEPSL